MFAFFEFLGLLLKAVEIQNGRLHIKLTLDIQDTDGNTIVLTVPPAPTAT